MILALRVLGLGDLLTCVPALRALRDAFPGQQIVLATDPGLAALALHTGAVDRVAPARGFTSLPAPVHGADLAVNLHGRGPQSHRLLIRTAPRRLLGFANAEAGVNGPRWQAGEHEVHRWCRLLVESGIAADPSRLGLAPPPPEELPAAVHPATTVIHPGAASQARRWPVERWSQVARQEVADGHPVVVTGGPADAERCRNVVEGAGLPPEACLAGSTDVMQLAAVVAVAGIVLCGDTGVAHLATALGIPSVVLFGPVPPAEWGPPPDRRSHVALWAGRRGDPHGDVVDPGLLSISPAEVLAAAGRVRSGG